MSRKKKTQILIGHNEFGERVARVHHGGGSVVEYDATTLATLLGPLAGKLRDIVAALHADTEVKLRAAAEAKIAELAPEADEG